MPFPRQLEALQIVDLNIPTPTPSWPPRGGGSPHCLPGRRRTGTPPNPKKDPSEPRGGVAVSQEPTSRALGVLKLIPPADL